MSLWSDFLTNQQRVVDKWKHYFPAYERHFGEAAGLFELVEGISFNDLTPDPNTIAIAPAVWETKDIDSQFVLTRRIEPGSYVIEIDTSVSEPAEATPLCLYFAEEGGSFCTENCYVYSPLRVRKGAETRKLLVRFKKPVIALRLDPLERPRIFYFSTFKMFHCSSANECNGFENLEHPVQNVGVIPLELIPLDVSLAETPTNQSVIELLTGWMSAFPEHLNVKVGSITNMFEDRRAFWAIKKLGGVTNKNVLELGPMEAYHSYILQNNGVGKITAIEANKRNYLKCLIVKELLKINKADFLLGDFVRWLEESPQYRFDIIWCMGVLYHMPEPIKLLELLSKHTDKIVLWTHHIPDDGNIRNLPIVNVDIRNGIEHFIWSYGEGTKVAHYCGGIYNTSAWLKKNDIISTLQRLGYKVEVSTDKPVLDSFPDSFPAIMLVALR